MVGSFEMEDPGSAGNGVASETAQPRSETKAGASSNGVAMRLCMLAVGLLLGAAALVYWLAFPTVARTEWDAVAVQFATRMGIELTMNDAGNPSRLGEGNFGTIYNVQNNMVLKVQLGPVPGEALIGQVLPEFDRLTKIYQIDELTFKGKVYSGMQMLKDPGVPMEKRAVFPNKNALLYIAADLAVALHAMHSKVNGHVILHCDILPKNVLAHEVANGLGQATLIDYGISMAGALEEGETPLAKIFWYNTDFHHCRGTDWEATKFRHYYQGVRPYGAAADWRELGLMLWVLAENPGSWDLSSAESRIQKHMSASCATRCALERLLGESKNLRQPLLGFVKYLVLEHDQILDEVQEILGHAAFADVEPSPVDRARAIVPVEPTERFKSLFGRLQPPLITRRVAAQIVGEGDLTLVPGGGGGVRWRRWAGWWRRVAAQRGAGWFRRWVGEDKLPELWPLEDRPDLSLKDTMWTLTPSWSGMISICSKTNPDRCLKDRPSQYWTDLWTISNSTSDSTPMGLHIVSYTHLWLSAVLADDARTTTLRLDNGPSETWAMAFFDVDTLKPLESYDVISS